MSDSEPIPAAPANADPSSGVDAGTGLTPGTTAPATGTTAPESVTTAAALPAPALEIASGYAFTGPALDLGALLWDGQCLPDAQIRIPLGMLNRHGLVAGATGTGKTKTLQLIAEQLSAQGVPVFLADIKGDVSGISAPGEPGHRVTQRAAEVGQEWRASGCPERVLRARRHRPRHPPAGHHHRLRPGPAVQGASSSTRRRSSRSA